MSWNLKCIMVLCSKKLSIVKKMEIKIMQSSIFNKLLDLPAPLLNLIFVGIMIGGSILILSLLYLIYDVQIFGERLSTKTDLMLVSITFTIIHIILTNGLLIAFKKIRYAKTIIQKEKE